RLRLRSPRSAVIWFHWRKVASSRVRGVIASRTRSKAKLNSRHRLRIGGFPVKVIAPGGNRAPYPRQALGEQSHQQLGVQPGSAAGIDLFRHVHELDNGLQTLERQLDLPPLAIALQYLCAARL